jgi:hypothetical protein
MPSISRSRRAEDAISFLEGEHTSTRELLAMLQRPLNGRARERVVLVLVEDLRIHLQIETEIFYRALAARPDGPREEPAKRAAIAEALLDLERTAREGADLRPMARRLLALHEQDAAEEERIVFPHARRLLGERALVALGAELRVRRRELRESGPTRGTSGAARDSVTRCGPSSSS